MRILRSSCGPFFIFAGVMHFLAPRTYERIVPPWLPAPRTLVYLSGIAEAAGGAALLRQRTRRWGGWWLVLTLLAVFPANVEMALHADRFPDLPVGSRALWARLPLQAVFIGWVLAAAQPDDSEIGHARSVRDLA